MINIMASSEGGLEEFEWPSYEDMIEAAEDGRECPDEEDAVITLDVDGQSYSEDSLRDMGIWNFADLVEAARNDEI